MKIRHRPTAVAIAQPLRIDRIPLLAEHGLLWRAARLRQQSDTRRLRARLLRWLIG